MAGYAEREIVDVLWQLTMRGIHQTLGVDMTGALATEIRRIVVLQVARQTAVVPFALMHPGIDRKVQVVAEEIGPLPLEVVVAGFAFLRKVCCDMVDESRFYVLGFMAAAALRIERREGAVCVVFVAADAAYLLVHAYQRETGL